MDYILNKPKSLPLSWIRHENNTFDFTNVPINKNCEWISLAKVSKQTTPHIVLDYIEKHSGKFSILRGCNSDIRQYLKSKGFGSVYIGKEAVLEFGKDHFEKKSLKKLIKRGSKYGKVIELPYNEENRNKIEKFKKISAHGNEPQLKFLYFSSFVPNTRMFVLTTEENSWLAAVQISVNSNEKLHTELLLRKKDAPVGVMEFLISEIFRKLENEGFKEWSLGEVPFLKNKNSAKPFSKSAFVTLAGRMLKFAYNYEGLYFFKNKFNPRWDDVYVCARPKVKLSTLFLFVLKINLHKLVFSKIFPSIN